MIGLSTLPGLSHVMLQVRDLLTVGSFEELYAEEGMHLGDQGVAMAKHATVAAVSLSDGRTLTSMFVMAGARSQAHDLYSTARLVYQALQYSYFGVGSPTCRKPKVATFWLGAYPTISERLAGDAFHSARGQGGLGWADMRR